MKIKLKLQSWVSEAVRRNGYVHLHIGKLVLTMGWSIKR